MTTPHENDFHLTVSRPDTGTVLLRLSGDLDYDSADELLHAARDVLTAAPVPRALLLDCERLTTCDSMGLSTLLMAERIAGDAGTALRLENRPDFLGRLLEITGTSDLFSPVAPAEPSASPDADGPGRGPLPDGQVLSDKRP
ncbi:STAS domain-containing protein [Streptomyces sp. NPDC087512]|uniref:STAS domain-containing protein n=1 Tax=unclassified Streptomyces TaxID=2593676 RepID=UPI00342CEFD5